MERRRGFKRNIISGILFLIILSFSTLSLASADINKDIGALKEEIKTAQEKIDKAKLGQTLEAITLPVSIKNMQKILGSLSQKTAGDPNLSAKVKNLSSSLNSLEGAKKKNDKPRAQRFLNEMEDNLKAIEIELAKADKVRIKDSSAIKSPSPSLAITSFRRCIAPGTVAMSMTRPGEEPTSTTINIGEEVCLQWRIEGCNVRDITARFARPGFPQLVNPGERIDEGGGCFRMVSEKRIKPIDDTTYTLTATGVPVISASKTFTVNVKRPQLVILDPQIKRGGSFWLVTFFAKNVGDLDFTSTPILVTYSILLGFDQFHPLVEEHSFRTEPLSIPMNGQVTLGQKTAMLLEAPLFISIRLVVYYQGVTMRTESTFRWKED